MKRYFTFYGMEFYPNEGMDDFIGDFDTLEEGIEAVKQKNIEEGEQDTDYWWAIVWDSETRKNVYTAGAYTD